MLDSLQVTGAGVLRPMTQGTNFAPSTFIFALEMQRAAWAGKQRGSHLSREG